MTIAFITYDFPDNHNRNSFVFVKQLVDKICELGHNCIVIAPYNVIKRRRYIQTVSSYSVDGHSIQLIRPWYLSLSRLTIKGIKLSEILHKKAVNRGLKKMKMQPDVIYAHFWNSGYEAYNYAKRHCIPIIVASGESSIEFTNNINTSDFCSYVSGVVCVSSKNMEESIKLRLTTQDKCAVFPNAINNQLFKKYEKDECRIKMGFPKDVFIIAFVGWFNERKGAQRVADAINRISDKKVYSLFIGSGESAPICDNILFKGPVEHELIPLYLNCADAFVLPTLREGCCNAVIEALACGLPVISSNLSFNKDVLNNSNSILINPLSIEDIADAIELLYDNPQLRETLSKGAISKAKSLQINNRAKSIISFINGKIN